jgi:hypothetical protein
MHEATPPFVLKQARKQPAHWCVDHEKWTWRCFELKQTLFLKTTKLQVDVTILG